MKVRVNRGKPDRRPLLVCGKPQNMGFKHLGMEFAALKRAPQERTMCR